jgi:hypothetical protein
MVTIRKKEKPDLKGLTLYEVSYVSHEGSTSQRILSPYESVWRGTRTLKPLQALDFKSSVYTNSTIQTLCSVLPRDDNNT